MSLLTDHPFANADVLVVYGGDSAEREVSLRTGAALLSAAQEAGFSARGLDLRRASVEALLTHRPDVVLVAMHGTPGEDGTLQGLLEFLRIPYTGSGVLASALAMDKVRTKQIIAQANVPTAPWTVVGPDTTAIPSMPGLPCVLKPSLDGSSVGVAIVRDDTQWAAGLETARAGRGVTLMERFVAGRELSVGLLDGEVIGVIEIRAAEGFYDYEAKYRRGDTRYERPNDLEQGVLDAIERAARGAYTAVGCRGVARVDVILDDEFLPWVLEVNTVPGMTATSLVPKMAAALGVDFPAFAARMLRGATTDEAVWGTR